jgi:ubiquinone biosynthesis protein
VDFQAEIRHQKRFESLFAEWGDVIVPRLHEALSDSDVIVSDFVRGRRIDDPAVPDADRRHATRTTLRALYAMLFEWGLVHCDLHPGNILVSEDSRVAVIDYGYVVELTGSQRRHLAQLFWAMATNDGASAASVALETALFVPARVSVRRLATDLDEVLTGDRTRVDTFQIATFVVGLFDALRRHRIIGGTTFMMAVVALVGLEGTLKQAVPDLDFQREAMPWVAAALDG